MTNTELVCKKYKLILKLIMISPFVMCYVLWSDWLSGSMPACQPGDPGSNPGRSNF